jgi:hypothetical protein
MADLNDPAQLGQVLQMLSANDGATIKQGEKLLKGFLKQPASVPAVLNQMQSSDVRYRHVRSLVCADADDSPGRIDLVGTDQSADRYSF